MPLAAVAHASSEGLAKRAGFHQPERTKNSLMDEADRLIGLFDAGDRVLANMDADSTNAIAEAVRETCRVVEARLAELGIRPDEVPADTP
jgi:hypothetical protein